LPCRAFHGNIYDETVHDFSKSGQSNLARPRGSAYPRGASNSRPVWTFEMDTLLLEVVQNKKDETWKKLAEKFFPEFSGREVLKRYLKIYQSPTSGPWTSEEVALLKKGFSLYGNNWIKVSMIVKTRNSDQCKIKFNQIIEPCERVDSWTREESKQLLDLVLKSSKLKLLRGRLIVSKVEWEPISETFQDKTPQQCYFHFMQYLSGQAKAKLTSSSFELNQHGPNGSKGSTPDLVNPSNPNQAPKHSGSSNYRRQYLRDLLPKHQEKAFKNKNSRLKGRAEESEVI
ncbi:hypothetical protein L0F63_002456, partial [Massospora cicadina]